MENVINMGRTEESITKGIEAVSALPTKKKKTILHTRVLSLIDQGKQGKLRGEAGGSTVTGYATIEGGCSVMT